MFNIFEDVAESENKPSPRVSASVYESAPKKVESHFIPSASFSRSSALTAIGFNEKIPSHKKYFPVIFGACVGIALHSSVQAAFPPLLIASLLSLYRR